MPNTTNTNFGTLHDYLSYMVGVLWKPYNTFKREEERLSDIKTVSILSLIMVGILTIVKLLSTMISAVRTYSFWDGKTRWEWGNLKHVPYFKVIGQGIFMYAGILLAVAGIYFLANYVAIKKEVSYVKLLGVTTTAFIPTACALLLSPLLSLISVSLGMIITVVGVVYTLVVFLELVNEFIQIENVNTRIYFHLICLSIIFVGGGFLAYKIMAASLMGDLGALGSMF